MLDLDELELKNEQEVGKCHFNTHSKCFLIFERKKIKYKKDNGTLAEAWRGGIGKYPPHPERLPMPTRRLEAKPTEEGGICNLEG